MTSEATPQIARVSRVTWNKAWNKPMDVKRCFVMDMVDLAK